MTDGQVVRSAALGVPAGASSRRAEDKLEAQVEAQDPPEKRASPDIKVTNHGSLFMVAALTEVAHDWLRVMLQPDAQWLGNSVAVEPRYIEGLVEGMRGDGLVVA